ncbi:MAG: hypothetical protein HZA54_17535 [Planctomycetes bacterium]|nr:hypothetical protein [Planctomycetota bacterium]
MSPQTARMVEALCFLFAGTFLGMGVLCLGELFRSLREIAMNTRRAQRDEDTVYPAMGFISSLAHVVALFIFIGAVAAAVSAFNTGYNRKAFRAHVTKFLTLGEERWEELNPAETGAGTAPEAEKPAPAGDGAGAGTNGAGAVPENAASGGAGGAAPQDAAATATAPVDK